MTADRGSACVLFTRDFGRHVSTVNGDDDFYFQMGTVEFPVSIRGLFRPHYVTWSEQQMIEFHASEHLRNVVRVITETGLRVYKELMSMKKDQVDLDKRGGLNPDSKTPNGVAEVPLTPIAVQAFQDQLRIAGPGAYLFASDKNESGHQTTLKTVWHKTLKRAKIPYFRIYHLRSTYATRLRAGGVADEWVTQMLRQGDAKVFKKYAQMKIADEARGPGKDQPPGERGKGS
jgi:integrase